MYKQKGEPQLIQIYSVGVSRKASQEVVFDSGTVVPASPKLSPVILSGEVGGIKDNGKVKL